MDNENLTVRDRWYRLHRARRVFRNNEAKHLRCMSAHNQPLEMRLRAAERSINPPIIIDPLLPRLA